VFVPFREGCRKCAAAVRKLTAAHLGTMSVPNLL